METNRWRWSTGGYGCVASRPYFVEIIIMAISILDCYLITKPAPAKHLFTVPHLCGGRPARKVYKVCNTETVPGTIGSCISHFHFDKTYQLESYTSRSRTSNLECHTAILPGVFQRYGTIASTPWSHFFFGWFVAIHHPRGWQGVWRGRRGWIW